MMGRLQSSAVFGVALAAVLGAGSCDRPDPYTLERVDYAGEQKPAAILLGDPKVSRA